jgi:hypothetical protein
MAGIANTGVAAIVDRTAAALRIPSLVMAVSSISINGENQNFSNRHTYKFFRSLKMRGLSRRAPQRLRRAG